MDKKIIFFDIDGTLLNAKGIVPESTKEALRELKQKGHLRFICTGRTKSMLPESIRELGFDGYVYGGGTRIEYKDDTVFDYEIETEVIKKVSPILMRLGFVFLFEGTNNLYYEAVFAKEERSYFSQFVKGFGSTAIAIKDYETIHASKISMLPPNNMTDEILDEFIREMKPYFNIIIHESANNDILTDGLIELVPIGMTKGTGIEKTIERLGILKEATVGVGDSNNDLEMLKFVDTAIVMGNGSENAKNLATFITKHIDDDGIYYAMKQLNYI